MKCQSLATVAGLCLMANSAIAYIPATHDYNFESAATILANDGRTRAAAFASTYMSQLQDGSYWADWGGPNWGNIPWNAVWHYSSPFGMGLLGLPSGETMARLFMTAAVTAWVAGNRPAAAWNLGVVCHLVQDATVPHHSNLTPFDWHSSYENRCNDYHDSSSAHIGEVTATSSGYYTRIPLPLLSAGAWVRACAMASAGLLPLCDGRNPEWWCPWVIRDKPLSVARQMMPLAQRQTAGLIDWFAWMAGF